MIVKALEMAMDKDFRETDVYPKGTWTAETSEAEPEPVAPREALQQDGPHVTAETSEIEDGEGCTAQWYAGETMDWNMAVSALF